MSTIKLYGKEHEMKFSFNSFKYMKEFNFKDLETLEDNPFKLATMLQTLLVGALNSNPRIKVPEEQVVSYLEEFSKDGDLSDLLSELLDILQESNFFKSLQKTAPETEEN